MAHGHSTLLRTKDIDARFDFSPRFPRTDRPPRAGNQERLHQAQNATSASSPHNHCPPILAPGSHADAQWRGGRVLAGCAKPGVDL